METKENQSYFLPNINTSNFCCKFNLDSLKLKMFYFLTCKIHGNFPVYSGHAGNFLNICNFVKKFTKL